MHAIGVDIGGTKIAVGVVNGEGQILAQTRRETMADCVETIDIAIADAVNELMKDHTVEAIGLAAAGFINSDRQSINFAPNIAWRNYPLAQKVGALIDGDLPIVVENDANAAGWAEFQFGVGRHITDMLMLTVGTGLGGAVIVGSQLVRGKWGLAAEVGHIRVVPEGHYCGCGREGCWEQYASGSALEREAQQAAVAAPHRAQRLLELAGGSPLAITGPHVTQAAREGDGLAVDLLALLGRWLGEGAASVAALLDPEMIVIGGGVGEAGELLMLPLRHGYESQLSAVGHRAVAKVELAHHGNEAGIVGAADLARQ